jgi:hypothetical protein
MGMLWKVKLHLASSLPSLPHRNLSINRKGTYILIFFYSSRDDSHAEVCFMLHSHISWPRSGDCGRSRIRTRDSCVLCLVSPSCFNQLSHHIPQRATTSPKEPPHPPKSHHIAKYMYIPLYISRHPRHGLRDESL